MINKLKLIACFLFTGSAVVAQEVEFTEYDLDNGLHVILHQDNTAPVVSTSVMYHVGGKDLKNNKTGFAHFFEHLLFEGTKNIGKGEFMSIINSNGGSFNATTSLDRTYYYETFPSNKLELGLWLESERMLHPIIGEEGVETQNEVVKEERRRSYDNRPYGNLLQVLQRNLFEEHPYKDPNIGYMDDLDAATLEEFNEYFDEYYAPNNATLVVAGDIEIEKTKKLILINSFNEADFIKPEKGKSTKTTCVWFSQNISFNRGLENLFETAKRIDNIEFHIVGSKNQSFLKTVELSNNIIFHDIMEQSKLHSFLSTMDIGLALEPGKDYNNLIALSNKMLAYAQAGCYILATNTFGQSQFLNSLNYEAGEIIKVSLKESLQSLKLSLLDNQSRIDRWNNAKAYSWDNEQLKLKTLLR